ncbi:MAG: phosphoglycerate mutase family protein [Chitinophagaceae bacterium]
MRSLIIVFVSSLLLLSCKSTTIYLVRHAEKNAQPTDNPHLTDEGKTRAIILRDLLKDKDVRHIYSTNYHRTMETATPLSSSTGVNIEIYKNDTLGKFLNKIKALSGNVLIVGHSNTAITMLDSLRLTHTIKSIPDNDYDNLFIILVKNGRVKNLTESKYGALSPVDTAFVPIR